MTPADRLAQEAKALQDRLRDFLPTCRDEQGNTTEPNEVLLIDVGDALRATSAAVAAYEARPTVSDEHPPMEHVDCNDRNCPCGCNTCVSYVGVRRALEGDGKRG